MMKRRRRKCMNWGMLFRSDSRKLRHRSASPCRKANKAVSQTRWLSRSQNRNHLQGPKRDYNFKPVVLL